MNICIGQRGVMVKGIYLYMKILLFVGSNPIAETKYFFTKMPFFIISFNLQQSIFMLFCSELLRGIEEPRRAH